MKLKKVYDEIIKASLNNYKSRILLGKWEDDKIAISTDGIIMYFLPEKDFIFDVEKILRGRSKFYTKPHIDAERESKPVSMTGEMKKLDKMTAVKVGEKWLDEKYLKPFENPTFKTTERFNSPVYVYENDNLVALIMPIRHKESEEK